MAASEPDVSPVISSPSSSNGTYSISYPAWLASSVCRIRSMLTIPMPPTGTLPPSDLAYSTHFSHVSCPLFLCVRNSDASVARRPMCVKSSGAQPGSDSRGVVRNDPDVDEMAYGLPVSAYTRPQPLAPDPPSTFST